MFQPPAPPPPPPAAPAVTAVPDVASEHHAADAPPPAAPEAPSAEPEPEPEPEPEDHTPDAVTEPDEEPEHEQPEPDADATSDPDARVEPDGPLHSEPPADPLAPTSITPSVPAPPLSHQPAAPAAPHHGMHVGASPPSDPMHIVPTPGGSSAGAPSRDMSAAASAAASTETPPRKRNLQHVSTISQRREVIAWMEQQHALGQKHLPSKAVHFFTQVFRGTMKANLMKASRWYKTRHTFKAEIANALLAGAAGKRLINRKAAPGRGRKQAPWVAALYKDLLTEYHRMRRSATKINNSLLKTTATHLLMWNSNPAYSPENVPRITTRWVQQFMDANGIVVNKPAPKRPAKAKKG